MFPRLICKLFELPDYFGYLVSENSPRFSVAIYCYIISKTQYFEQQKLDEFQKSRLAVILEYAKNEIPFYQKLLKNLDITPDCLYKIPSVSKDQMRALFNKKQCINLNLLDRGLLQHTSGSTGVPLNFYLDKGASGKVLARYRRMLNWAGRTPEDTLIKMMPREHLGLESEGVFLHCIDPEDLENKIEKFYQFFENKSIILQSRVSHLIRLAQLIERDKKKFKFKALISYTEQLFPEVRAYLIKIFGAPVFGYYASSEILAMGFECEFHEGLHVLSEFVFIEIVNEKKEPVRSGEIGDILVTSFDNKVMPFIRYQIGDRASWISESCACGRTLPRIYVEGRRVNTFILPNGQIGLFASLVYPIAVLVNKIRQYQVIRHSQTKFEVIIVPTNLFNSSDYQFIINRFVEYIGKEAIISLRIVSKINHPSGSKQQAFIDLCPGK